jgi:hypothetical protein
MYSLSRSTLNYVLTAQIYTKTVYLLSTYTLKLLSLRVLPPTRRKTGRASHLHHLLPTPFSSSPSLFFFRTIMTFSAEFRCYIGVGTLAPWPTALGGLLSPRATALRHDAVARGARPLTPRRRALRLGHARGPLLVAPSAVAHDVLSLTPWVTTPNVYFC